jgi:alkylation response protein AidB-like acyl-CoA dehydrogenase
VASLKTSARRENGEWVLSGSKMWCSFAHKASHVLIVCRTERTDNPHEGMSMILVPHDADGFTITPIDTLGGEDTNELHLDDVRVPEDALLGTEGAGWTQLMAGLNNERVILAATALGLAQRAFDDALAYAKERRQFGRPIGSFQALQHKFAEMVTDLARTRLLVRWVARMTDEDPSRMLPQEASMAKLAATELAKRCALDGLQIMGGYGYATEYPMERHLRSAVVTTSSRRRWVSSRRRRAIRELGEVAPPLGLDLEAVGAEGALDGRRGAVGLHLGGERDAGAPSLLPFKQAEQSTPEQHRVAGGGRERGPGALVHAPRYRRPEELRLPR